MEMIIRQMMIDSAIETIEKDNTICCVSKRILKSVAEEAEKDKKVSIDKIQDLLTIQNVLLTTHDAHLASKKLSKKQIEERIAILDVLKELTKSLFDNACNALNKRLNELKDGPKDELSGLTKDELIDLIKKLEKEQEQK